MKFTWAYCLTLQVNLANCTTECDWKRLTYYITAFDCVCCKLIHFGLLLTDWLRLYSYRFVSKSYFKCTNREWNKCGDVQDCSMYWMFLGWPNASCCRYFAIKRDYRSTSRTIKMNTEVIKNLKKTLTGKASNCTPGSAVVSKPVRLIEALYANTFLKFSTHQLSIKNNKRFQLRSGWFCQ